MVELPRVCATINVRRKHLQLQQGQVGIAIECPVLTLLHDIVLEYRGRLGVVSVEAVQDGINVGRPGLALVEGDDHLGRI